MSDRLTAEELAAIAYGAARDERDPIRMELRLIIRTLLAHIAAQDAELAALRAIAQAAEDFYQAERRYDAALVLGGDINPPEYGDLFSARIRLFDLLDKRRALAGQEKQE